ncbi:MAG: DNA internalization-related competence protein ComEC/Rec2 [Thermoleophilia bacterium]|nr:DNA internalization-related competence protein ComEC/Rec2 [Thermoleophilia bacterium]
MGSGDTHPGSPGSSPASGRAPANHPVYRYLVKAGGCFNQWVILSYLAGLSASLVTDSSRTIAAAGAASISLLAGLFIGGQKSKNPVLVLAAFAFLGLFTGSARIAMLESSFLASLTGEPVTVEFTVDSRVRLKGDTAAFQANVKRVEWREGFAECREKALVKIFCRGGCPEAVTALEEGSLARMRARLKKPEASPGGDFDYGRYLRRQGINVTLEGSHERLEILPGQRGGVSGMIDSLRRYSREGLQAGDWGDAGSLLRAMVLGDKQVLPERVADDFRDSGLSHIVVVSGQHVVLLGFIVMMLLRMAQVPRLAATLISALVICVYVPITGSGPSAMRAGVVGVLGMAATLLSRQADRYHFLALAAAMMMTINPFVLLEPGFQLSFAAVLGIFLVSPVFSARLRFMPAALREIVSISASAGLATAPITLMNFQHVSLVTVPANVAAAPGVGLVMFLGILAILARPALPLLGWLLAAAASAGAGYLMAVARFFASLPIAVYDGYSPGAPAVILLYGLFAGGAVLLKKTGMDEAAGWVRSSRLAAPLLLLTALLIGIICIGFGGARVAPPDSLTISFLDVGQGDATLIRTPSSESAPAGHNILIDGGSGSQVVDRLRERGVTRLDAVFLTHPDADHLSGLLPVLEKFPVSGIHDAAPPSSSPLYRDFLELAEKKGITYHVARKGQNLAFGDLSLDVLWPGERMNANDANANSIVIMAAWQGLDILLPGDAEGQVLKGLDLKPVDIYMVPHHGSRDDHIGRVLERIKPLGAVVSVGAKNAYGHPAQETLDALDARGVQVFRTDEHGTIQVTYAGGNMEIRKEG